VRELSTLAPNAPVFATHRGYLSKFSRIDRGSVPPRPAHPSGPNITDLSFAGHLIIGRLEHFDDSADSLILLAETLH
jgi:hypothetical protein